MATVPRFDFLRAVTFSLVAAVLACFSATVAAQDRTITVLSFSANGDFGDLPTAYYNAMRAQAEFHPNYRLNDVPEQSLDEMLSLIGCPTLSTDCSALLQEILDSELLASGEIYQEGELTAVRIVLWDLAAGAESTSRTFAFANGRAVLAERVALFTRAVLYGNDGAVRVTSSPSGATVYLNGEERGQTPLTIENLPLGLYNVRVEADGYMTRTDAVAVDLGRADVDFQLTSSQAVARRRTESSQVGTYISWGLIGTGVALVGAGVGFGIAKSGTQSDFDDLLTQPIFDRAEAESLRDRGESQALASNLLLGAGGVALATGVVLLIVNRGGESRSAASTSTGARAREWNLAPSFARDGGALRFDMRF